MNPEQVVALVHTVAYANFQNRIFWRSASKSARRARYRRSIMHSIGRSARGGDSGRRDLGRASRRRWARYRRAGRGLERTGVRRVREGARPAAPGKPRIPMPDPTRLAGLPPEVLQRSAKIVWSNVSMGYQPGLTMTWFDCMRTFQGRVETRPRLRELAVLGDHAQQRLLLLNGPQRNAARGRGPRSETRFRSANAETGRRRLVGLPARRALAFRFAYKLTQEPAAVTDRDVARRSWTPSASTGRST